MVCHSEQRAYIVFRNKILRRTLQDISRLGTLQNESFVIVFFTHYFRSHVKKVEMDITCSTNNENERLHHVIWIALRKEIRWRRTPGSVRQDNTNWLTDSVTREPEGLSPYLPLFWANWILLHPSANHPKIRSDPILPSMPWYCTFVFYFFRVSMIVDWLVVYVFILLFNYLVRLLLSNVTV
jgi:hypothetical protein